MSDNIVVAVRMRPLIAREEADFSSIHWQLFNEHTITQVDPSTQKPLYTPYKFDRVFGIDYSNEKVYVEVAEPIVESALCGFNGTIFAYGQTSSGKTFTMMGDKNNPGIIPLAIQNIFSSIENTPNREYLIRASYMEIYNENITDLLADRSPRGKPLSIREDISGAVYVADLKEECVNCVESLFALMKKGDKNRHVGVTNMNERSSRSHTIFRLILESRKRSEEDGSEGAVTVSHLNLVDLAGSENAAQSGATGERLKEGGFINKSLFMLGRVISQLSDGEQFINFRDSKLTRILQLSLGGNAKTAIFCTVTPATIEQTHSTLRFASRAKSIKNKPVVNEVLSDNALLKRYAKEIKNLKLSLEKERNTDKAQEVEQVREMLGEQARRNEELVAKVNELKAKLVVSSLPLNYSKDCAMKKKKSRRETWAAPAVIRAMRASLEPVRIEPIKLDHEFLRPEIPRLAELTEVPEIPSTDDASSVVECSFLSEGFGREETSFCLDMAEQSKLGKFDASFTSPFPVNVKRRRKVHFEVTSLPTTDNCDAECQTEEALLPKIKFLSSSYQTTPKRGGPESHVLSHTCGTPGTPAHILRERNQELRQKLDEQEKWLTDWQKEMNELKEYQKNELRLLLESFDAKVADTSFDNTELENQKKDILSLKHSLRDAESLLLDANLALSQKSQDMLMLQEQLEKVNAENFRCSSFEAEVIKLREEHKALKKALEDKENEVTLLRNDRQDFDLVMELALNKQKQLEKDLRRSLDDAWKEIATYKGGNKEAVHNSSQHISILAEDLSQLHTSTQKGQGPEQIISDLKQQLEEAHLKQQASQQEIEEQILKLQEMEVLLEKMKKVESQVSCMETLESELSEAQDEVRSLRTDNIHLRNTANELQVLLDNKLEGGVSENQAVQEEMQCLQKKFEETDGEEVFSVPLPLHGNTTKGDTTVTSLEISRKLSETLHALEESVFLPSTPRRMSVSSQDEPFLQTQDLEIIKQQLLGLQELLLAQDLYQQQQQQKLDTLKAEATHERLYHSQVVADLEKELATWKVQESFYGDFIINSWNSHKLEKRKLDKLSPVQTTPIPKYDTTFIASNNKEDYTESGSEIQFKDSNSVLKSGFYDTDVKMNVHCMPLEKYVEFQFPAYELQQADRDMTCCTKASKLYVPNHELHSSTEEIKQMKCQLEQLKHENALLTDQMKQFKEISLRSGRIDILKEQLSYTSEEEKLLNIQNKNQEGESVYVTPQQSLADELCQAGMNIEFCDEALETSIFNCVSDASSQGVQQLEHQLEQLSQESCFTYTKHLKTNLDQLKENISTEQGEIGIWNQSIAEKYKNMIQKLEMELQSVLAERNTLEIEMGKLKEKLSDKVILEEEIHCFKWQVENLKQEKSDLMEEFKLIEESYEKRLEKFGASITDDIYIKESIEMETDQLSIKEDPLHCTEVISSSRYSAGIIPKDSITIIEELESAKRKNDSLEKELDRLKENNVSEAGKEESSLAKEDEKYVEMKKVLEEMKEKLKTKSKELVEVREISSHPHCKVEILNLFKKELEDAKEIIASLKVKLGYKGECLESELETVETAAELREVKEIVLSLKGLQIIFEDRMLGLEAKDKIVAYEAGERLDTDCLKESTLLSDEIKEKQKELENTAKKIYILEKEKENQYKYFEEQLANVIAEKDSELEMMTTNFTEKEEIFENKEREMEQLVMEIGEARNTLADKEVELQKLKGEHTNLRTMVNDLQSSLIQRNEEYSLLDEKHSKLQNELALLKAEYEKRIHEIMRNGTSYEEQLSNQTLDEAALSKSNEEQKILNVAEELSKQTKDNLDKGMNEAVPISGNTTSTSISESLDILIINKKLDELEHLKNEYASKVKEYNQVREVSDNLKIILSTKEEKLKDMSSEHSKEISFFTENLSKKEELIDNLEDVLKDKKEELVCLRSAIEAKDIKIKRLESYLKEAQLALDNKERDHQEALSFIEAQMSSKAQAFQEEIECLIKQYEEVCTDRKNMALVIKTHEEEAKRLTGDFNTLNLKLENLERNYQCIRETLETKEAEIVQKKNALSLLELDHQKLIEDNDILQSKEREWITQQEFSNHEMEKLVGIIEKYETEMSEKDEQIHKVRTEAESNIATYSKKLEKMTQKYAEAEKKVMKYVTLEEEFIKHGRDLSELQNLPEKLTTVEGKLMALQDELHDKTNEHSEKIAKHIHEKQELSDKLLHTEEQYRNVREKVDVVYIQLREKTVEVEALTTKLNKVEIELSETKLRFVESEGNSTSYSQFDSNETQGNELHKTMESLKEELLMKQEELAKREQEYAKLNAECDEIVEYYQNQGRIYGEQYTMLTEKLESTEKELSETKTKLEAFCRKGETLYDFNIASCDASMLSQHEREDEILLQEKNPLEKQLAATRYKVVQLEQCKENFKERINDLEECRRTLEEELKVSNNTVDSLLERLGDHDKLQHVYREEKKALEKQIDEYQNRIETFRQSAGDQRAALEKIDELMQNVTHLKYELQTSKKNFEDLVEEHSRWKIEYARLFKKFEELEAHSAKDEFLPQEQKIVHERKLLEVNTLPNTLIDCSAVNTYNLNITERRSKSKSSAHEKAREGDSMKSVSEFVRKSQGTVSTVEEHHCEPSQVKTDATAREHELGCLTRDDMERNLTALRKEEELLQDQREQGGAISKTEKLAELQRKYKELQEENTILRKGAETKATETSLTGEDSSNLQERLIVAERENDVLRFKLRALNAPAEKQVLTLTKELSLANQKASHLKNELRRVQNSNCMDSTMFELKGSDEAQSNAKSRFDFSSGSGIVLEVQVLSLQNEIYHLKKEKRGIESECKTLREHLDHYKNKAVEWKKNALKEKKHGEKVKGQLELLRTENSQYKTKMEESRSHIERQQFELGHQREIIEKLEKEKQEQSQKFHTENSAAFVESNRRQAVSHAKDTESVVGKGTSNNDVNKTKSCSHLQQLGVHNTPFLAPTRTEQLPCGSTSVEIQKNSAGNLPMWQSLNKENRDYSKYYLPPRTDKKKDEDCKTQ